MLKAPTAKRPSREVHTLSCRWQTPSAEYFKTGDAPPFYPNMRIITTSEEPEIINESYVVDFDCEGILGDDTFIELGMSESQPEEGWDEVSLSIFTREPDDPRWARGARLMNEAGAVVPGFENMYITSRMPKRHRAKGYHEIDLTLKGLRLAKPFKRRINGAVTSSSAVFPDGIVLSAPYYFGYPPVYTGSDATVGGVGTFDIEYEAATLALVDTWICKGDPPTDKIGGFWTPPSPPDILVTTLPGDVYKYYFPFGWKCTGMPCEQLPGTDLFLVSSSFSYQVNRMPIQP